ncbi:hypothetical protein MLD38_009013 [Melastoma candidum]|uniref:Uncharacterized protein n=1 Tax=Melastoma candidum TaxID=119954 RepID=A0ACB9S4Q0_9MYRT|nr:hypothetical protein MLD38_009013 [Melastoma candidum]
MLSFKCPCTVPVGMRAFGSTQWTRTIRGVVVCEARGPRPRGPRVWKTRKRIGTFSKSSKFIECVKSLSNVKEEVYGALDSFIAWELEFPLITVKKALKTLEYEKDWKRVIQVSKWMLNKGQGRTMGSYFALLNALAEDGRLDEAEELWAKIFSDHLEGTPRIFFDKMVSIYYNRGMHEKMFEVFADMEELGVKPNVSIVKMMGDVFQQLGMMDKCEKLNRKYPPPRWEYRYIKGKRIRIPAKYLKDPNGIHSGRPSNAGFVQKVQPEEALPGTTEVNELGNSSGGENSTDIADDILGAFDHLNLDEAGRENESRDVPVESELQHEQHLLSG